MTVFSHFTDLVNQALDALTEAGSIPAELDRTNIAVEPPRDASHGDLAINAAMVLA